MGALAVFRPDLAAMPAAYPNYLTPVLLPFQPVKQKTGTAYYDDIQADTTAQTGRTITDSPDSFAVASSKVSFDLDQSKEFIKDAQIPDSEITLLGGLDKAEAKGARKGKRAVMASLEALTAAKVLNNGASPVRDILGSVIAAIQLAKQVVADYAEGRVAVVGSQYVLDRLKRYPEVVDRMKFTGVLIGAVRDVRSISNDQLAAALDVDVVLGGRKSVWYDASAVYQDRLAVMVLPDPQFDPDETIQFGRTLVFPVEGAGDNIEVTTFPTDRPPANWVRARAYAEQHLFNPEACYILKGIDDGNAVTTSTTT